MSRIVEGIKELLKGKDDDEQEYRYRYEQRGSPRTQGYDGYPVRASPDGRSEYLADGRSAYYADGRSGYPSEGRSGYAVDGRSGYPVDARSGYPVDGRSGYSPSSNPEVRRSYPDDGRSAYATEGRSRYPMSATADGRSGYAADSVGDGRSAYSSDGRSAYSVEGRSGYAVNVPDDGRRGYPVTAGGIAVPLRRQALDDDYVRSSYDSRAEARGEYRQPYGSSPGGSEYRQSYGIREASPRSGSEYRASPRVDIPPRGEYIRTTQLSPREYRSASGGAVIELMVPMCCDKCKEKVQEELSEVDGVDSVRCDPKNSRVIVTGDQFIDIDRCLTKAERAVKKKCELISKQGDMGTSKKVSSPSGYYETVEKTGILAPPTVSSRGSPGSRPTLARMPSFASGKVTEYDGVGPRGQDYDAKDYNGFRRLPSFSKHRHHEAEYISSFDERPEPRASSYRMPAYNRGRYNDAEYIVAGDDRDRDYNRRSYDTTGSAYTASYNDRPSLLSQVSFSKIPVENPNYMKGVANY